MRCVGVWLCLASGLLTRSVGARLPETTNEAHEPVLSAASKQAENAADNYRRNPDGHNNAPKALHKRC